MFEQEVYPSSAKFVLVALADNAGDTGEAWPSLKTITKKTGQDRKTVISALDQLQAGEWIRDTGRRVGYTNQVKVYAICALEKQAIPETVSLPNKSENGGKEFRKRTEREPKTEHGTVREPTENHQIGRGDELFTFASDSLPPPINTPEIKDAWDVWQEHLRQRKKKLSAEAARMQVAKLKALGPEQALAALRHSTENNYTGLFEPSGKANGQRPAREKVDHAANRANPEGAM